MILPNDQRVKAKTDDHNPYNKIIEKKLFTPYLTIPMSDAKTYYFLAASQKFLCEDEGEPLGETLKERHRNYAARNKEIDFWFIKEPAFLEAPELAQIRQKVPGAAAAIVSTDPQSILWLKLRLEFVVTGEFIAPSASIPDPLASLVAA